MKREARIIAGVCAVAAGILIVAGLVAPSAFALFAVPWWALAGVALFLAIIFVVIGRE